MKEEKFQTLMQKHIEDILLYCFEEDQHFGILCKIEHLEFNPELPHDIYKDFRDVTGTENIGSLLTVPLLSILQIIIDDTPVFINVANYEKKDVKELEPISDDGIQNSMSALLSNPENQKFKK